MKKIFLAFISIGIFLYFGVHSVNAEMVEIDTSLDQHTNELYVDPDVVDLDSYIHESDSGIFIIQDNKLIPFNSELSSLLSVVTPAATTRRWYPNINNGSTWGTTMAAINGQRITFGNKPRSSNVTYTRRVQINSSGSDGHTYYLVNQYGARSEYSFTVKFSTNRLHFYVTHYSPTVGFYETWITG